MASFSSCSIVVPMAGGVTLLTESDRADRSSALDDGKILSDIYYGSRIAGASPEVT